MEFTVDNNTAIVITVPQVDFLRPKGVTWKLVGKSVTENNTVQHIDNLFGAAQKNNMLVFVSPHYYYPHDHEWEIEGALEKMMHNINMFDRKDPMTLKEGSGADWMPQYKKYMDGKNVVVTSPHKVYGPETNDLALQLRKRGIDNVILAGMSANLCTESHMRALIEAGFKVAVVKDATAAAQTPDMDGYKAALTNFNMISSKVFTTSEVVDKMNKKQEIKKSAEGQKEKVCKQEAGTNGKCRWSLLLFLLIFLYYHLYGMDSNDKHICARPLIA